MKKDRLKVIFEEPGEFVRDWQGRPVKMFVERDGQLFITSTDGSGDAPVPQSMIEMARRTGRCLSEIFGEFLRFVSEDPAILDEIRRRIHGDDPPPLTPVLVVPHPDRRG